MGRHSCCYKQKLRKGLWSPEEDEKLLKHITKYGHGCWSAVPKQAGLQRCGKSCRLRWINYLRPDLKRGAFSQEEENVIIELHEVLGNRWSQIAAQLPGRTDNEIKNLWNSSIKKKLKQKGIDPNTHKPLSEVESGGGDGGGGNSNSNSGKPASGASNERKLPSSSTSGNSHSAPAAFPSQQAQLPVAPADKCAPVTLATELSLEQFIQESSSSSRRPSDPVGYLPQQQLNSNPLLWFNQNYRPLHVGPEFDFNMATGDVHPAPPSAALSLMQMDLKPVINLAPHNSSPGCISINESAQLWAPGNSANSCGSTGNSSGIDPQSSSSFFDSSLFPWQELASDRAAAGPMEGEPGELNWSSEYLPAAFLPPVAATQSQNQGLYNEVKAESPFVIGELGAWHQNQQQQQQQQQQLLQSSYVYGKDFQKISAAFGHI